MQKITFLGTSGSTPTKMRGLSAVALEYEGDVLLFDCGEGTQIQMLRYGINISKVKAIFLTHIHGDHVIGVAGVVRTLALNRRTQPLSIFVPRGYAKAIMSLVNFDRAIVSYPLIIKEVQSGKVYSAHDYTISAFRLNHSVPTYGYIFKQADKLHFIKQKCSELGIKGTMFKELQLNNKIKTGKRWVSLSQVTTRQPGKKIVYAADSRPAATTLSAARDADLLIHEATYTDELKQYARERMHATAIEAATIAKRANAKKLILTHISARYNSTKDLLQQAKKVFANSSIAIDGLVISI